MHENDGVVIVRSCHNEEGMLGRATERKSEFVVVIDDCSGADIAEIARGRADRDPGMNCHLRDGFPSDLYHEIIQGLDTARLTASAVSGLEPLKYPAPTVR